MKPNSKQAKDVFYFREIVLKTGLSQSEIARRIGVRDRTMRNYMKYGPPYLVQFAVECLVYSID